jgi:hypothetical protein
MTVLIANIGISDLTEKIDGLDYFFPLDARNEPNMALSFELYNLRLKD